MELSVACVLADRRGRLSLLCGIPLDRKNYPNRLPLCTPPLGGGWEGFLSEGICPYFVALSLIKGTLFSCREGRSFDARKASLRCEETLSLSADGTVHSPLHSERGRGRGSRECEVRLLITYSQPTYEHLQMPQSMALSRLCDAQEDSKPVAKGI